MKADLSALGAGLLFGAGLGVSGMTQPSKVKAFLDITGSWDPSLALVMVGAVVVHFILFRVVRRRLSPLFDVHFHIPTRADLDWHLIVGAAVFGAGWGLSGLCPGPALVSAGGASLSALVFVASMTIGMLAARFVQSQGGAAARREKAPSPGGGAVMAKGGSS